MAQGKNFNPVKLQPGQILSRKYTGLFDKIFGIITIPKTDFVHTALLAFPVDGLDDWMTFDATVRSVVSLVPLSKYAGQTVRIYSVNPGDRDFAVRVGTELLNKQVRYEGLSGWNYFFRLLPFLLFYWLRHGPKAIPWNDIPNKDSIDRINCWVLIRKCYPELIPQNNCVTASAIEQAYRDGKLVLEFEGIIPEIRSGKYEEKLSPSRGHNGGSIKK